MSVQTQNTNLNPYSGTPIKNLEYIQNKALVIAPTEITKNGLLDTDLMLDTAGSITMYFFRKIFNTIDIEPTAEQFKTVGIVSDISTKLGLDIAASNISSSSSSSYYLGFTKISVIFKYDKNTGIRIIEKDTNLLSEDYIDIGIDNTVDLTTEDYFVICNVTKNTKATNSSFTESSSMDFLFMIPSSECQEIITDFDILDVNNQVINVKKYGALGFTIDNDTTIEPAYQADFFGDGSNIATYLFDGTCRDLNGNYNGTATGVTYGEGKVGQAVNISTSSNILISNGGSLPFNTTNFAISFWYKPTSFANTNQTIFGTYRGGGGGSWSTNEWRFSPTHQWVGNKFSLAVYNINSGNVTMVSNTTTVLNKLYHIVITRNNGIINLYINGTLDNSVTINNSILFDNRSNNLPFYLGGPTSTTNCLGDLDQVRIFNKALNQNEVTALYLNNASTRVIKQETNIVPTLVTSKPDFFKDGSNIATYLFNGNCNDETGSYNGTGSGVSYVKGKFGQAVVAPGTTKNDYINLNIKPNFGTPTTVSFWEKGNSFSLRNDYYGGGYPTFNFAPTWFDMCISNTPTGSTRVLAIGFDTSNKSVDEFNHYVVTINYPDVNIYINGKLAGSGKMSQNVGVSNYPIYFGNYYYTGGGTSTTSYTGKIDNVRIFNRALNQREVLDLYNEQPSYEEQLTLTEVTGKTLTPSGNPLIVYDRDIGPSIKFVNNRDYLTCLESNDFAFGTGDFTVESWVKFNNPFSTYPTQYICMLNTTGGIGFGIESGNLAFSARGVALEINYAWTPTVGVWYHLAATRENGVMKLWINGSNVATKTNTKNLSINTGTFYIGAGTPDLADNFYGYISQLHIVKGIAKYTTAVGNFTPASRLLQTANTVLLLQVDKPIINTDNWSKIQLESVEVIGNNVDQPLSIIDGIRTITLEAESEAIASEPDFFNDKSNIATYLFDNNANDANGNYNGTGTNITYGTGKFGKCAIFDGNLSLIDIPNTLTSQIKAFSANIKFNTTYLSSSYSWQFSSIICWSNTILNFGILANGKIRFYWYDGRGKYFDGTTVLTAGVWYNISFSITNNIVYVYLNGSLEVTGTFTNFVLGQFTGLRIGYDNSANKSFDGQLDNVRIFNRALTQTEVQDLYRETKRVKYKPVVLLEPASKFSIETQKEIKLLNYKTWTGTDATKQGYRLYPVMKISDHVDEEATFNPKYYLGTKYQRNITEILSQGIKSKRTISNLKDMYLVDDKCIQILKKINILLENDQMIKLTERLYNLATPLREKLNADLILEYISTPVSESQNNDIAATLKTSLMEDYNFTQEEIDNLNDNLNTFKSRARIALNAPVIQGSGLDQLRFNLPKTFIDGNKSKTEKKNLLIFGTDAGFNKFGLSGYSAPYSNISKRDDSSVLNLSDLTLDLPASSTIKNEIGNNVIGLSQNSDTDLYMYFTENNKVFISGRIAWTSEWEQDSVYTTALQLDLSNVTTESKIKMVDCSDRTMLILYENGDLYACGSSAYGVIPVSSMVPILIKQNIKHISAGINQFAILDTNNDLYTIGDNYYGNFNTGNSTDKTTWFKSASNVKSYSFCTSTLAVVYNDDTLWMCGGRYANFQSSGEVKTLTKITIPAKVKKIISRTEYTIILFENNSIRCSGHTDTIWTGNLTNNPRINVNPGFTATNIYGGHTQGMLYVSNNKLYGVPKLVISGNIAGNYVYTDLSSYFGDIQDIQDIKMYKSSIKIIKNDKNLYSIGRNWSGTFGNGSGADVVYSTLQLTNPRKFTSDTFKDILTNYKQQIPFTYIPLSTDIKDINDKPVFENLDNITGFEPTDIVIDIPNVL